MDEATPDRTSDTGHPPAVEAASLTAQAAAGVSERPVGRAIARGKSPAAKRTGDFHIVWRT